MDVNCVFSARDKNQIPLLEQAITEVIRKLQSLGLHDLATSIGPPNSLQTTTRRYFCFEQAKKVIAETCPYKKLEDNIGKNHPHYQEIQGILQQYSGERFQRHHHNAQQKYKTEHNQYYIPLLVILQQLTGVSQDLSSRRHFWSTKKVATMIQNSCRANPLWPKNTSVSNEQVMLALLLLRCKAIYHKNSWEFPNLKLPAALHHTRRWCIW